MDPATARAMWLALEPVHAVVYFAPEAKAAYEAAGLKGYWMGYFASRAAAMGAVPPEVVIATFYNFHERMVRRAIPDAWTFSTPERVLAARHALAGDAVGGALAHLEPRIIAEAARLAETAARAASPEGRPLCAAHASLPWPDEAHLRLWHAATILREHRGDGHVALLVAEGIDGCEAHVLAAAAGRVERASQQWSRGWSDDEWDAATARLGARGLVRADGTFTEDGAAFKRMLEDRTDALAAAPYDAIGDEGCARVIEILTGGTEPIPYPNAIGLPRAEGG